MTRQKRFSAFSLALFMMVNICFSAVGETTAPPSGAKLHTVSWTADADNLTLRPLTASRSSMLDEGKYLTNAEGVVQTQIHSVYCENQTLVSVGMAGTSFSFAPIMLEDYFPAALYETNLPDSADAGSDEDLSAEDSTENNENEEKQEDEGAENVNDPESEKEQEEQDELPQNSGELPASPNPPHQEEDDPEEQDQKEGMILPMRSILIRKIWLRKRKNF